MKFGNLEQKHIRSRMFYRPQRFVIASSRPQSFVNVRDNFLMILMIKTNIYFSANLISFEIDKYVIT